MPTIAVTTPMRLPACFQQAALLDMGLEIAAIPSLLQVLARRLVEAGGLQRLAHRLPSSR